MSIEKNDLIRNITRILKQLKRNSTLPTDLVYTFVPSLIQLQQLLHSKSVKFNEVKPVLNNIVKCLKTLNFNFSDIEAKTEIPSEIIKTFQAIIVNNYSEKKIKDSLKCIIDVFESHMKMKNAAHLSVPVPMLSTSKTQSNSEHISTEYSDFWLIALEMLEFFSNYPDVSIQNDQIMEIIHNNLREIHQCPGFVKLEFCETSLICSKKFVCLLKIMKSCLKKAEDLAKAIRETREKLKECFIISAKLCLMKHQKAHIYRNAELKLLFDLFLELLHNATEKVEAFKELYDIPVVVFHIIIPSILEVQDIELQMELKQRILSFLRIFYVEKLGKFHVSADIGVENLLFDSFLFDNNFEALRQDWNAVWGALCSNKSNNPNLVLAIMQNLKQNLQSFSYISSMNLFLNDLCICNSEFIAETVNYGLPKDILSLVMYENSHPESNQLLFQISSTLLNQNPAAPINKELLPLIFKKIIPSDLQNHELCKPIISKLLTSRSPETLNLFINYFDLEQSPILLQSLISAMLYILNSSDKAFLEILIAKNFASKVLKLLMFEYSDKSESVSNWVEVFEFLATLAKYSLKITLDFGKIIENLRKENLNECRNEIIEGSIENLLKIAINDKEDACEETACIVLLEYFCWLCKGSAFNDTICRVLEKKSNLIVFVKNKFFTVVFWHFSRLNGIGKWNQLEHILSNALRIGVDFYDFSRLVKLIDQLPDEPKESLLRILKNSLKLKKEVKPSKFEINCSNSLHFAGSQVMKLDLSGENSQILKNFAISLWIYAESSSCDIFILNSADDIISLFMHDGRLSLLVNSSDLIEVKCNKLNTWVLVCVNFAITQVAKMITRKKATLFLHTCNESIQKNTGKVRLSDKCHFSSIEFGGHSGIAVSRLKYFCIFNKALHEYEIQSIYSQTWKASFFDSTHRLRMNDGKVITELRECLVFVLDDFLRTAANPKHNLANYCVLPNIFIVINAFGATELIFRLTRNTENPNILCKIYEIAYKLVTASMEYPIVTEEFVRILARTFTIKHMNNKINSIYIKIIQELINTDFSKILFYNYIQSERCVFLLSKTKDFDQIIQIYKKTHPFCKKYFYKFCHLLKDLDQTQCEKHLKYYLTPNIEYYSNTIPSILIGLLQSEETHLIKLILNVLSESSQFFSNSNQIFVVLLHILEKTNEGSLQKSIIEILCSKVREEQSLDENQELKNVVDFIDSVLPFEASEIVIEYLLKEGLESKRFDEGKRLALVDMVLNRMEYVVNESTIRKVCRAFNENSEELQRFVYERNIFPHWLIFSMKNLKLIQCLEEMAMNLFIYFIDHSRSISKIRKFFIELPLIDLYSKVAEKSQFSNMHNCYSFFLILNAFPINELKRQSQWLMASLKSFRENQNFISYVLSTFSIDRLLEKVNYSETCVEINEDSFFFLGEYVKFCLKLLKILNHKAETFAQLNAFLSHSEIQFLNRTPPYEDPLKLKCEEYVSTFIFYNLVRLYYKNQDLVDHLRDFATKSLVFRKISSIMKDNYAEKFFTSIILADNAGFISESGFILSEHANSSTVAESKIANEYETLATNATICDTLFMQEHANIKEILDIRTFAWRVLFEKISVMVKNYKKIDKSFSSKHTQLSETFDKPMLAKCVLLKQRFEDLFTQPWADTYSENNERLAYKIGYDYEKYVKKADMLERVLSGAHVKSVKIRQCYDKYYRWVFLKPNLPKNKAPALGSNENHDLPTFTKVHSAIYEKDESCASVISQSRTDPSASILLSPIRNNKSSFVCQCEQIQIKGSTYGKSTVSKKFFEFISDGSIKPKLSEFFGSALAFTCISRPVRYIWLPSEIREIVLRRFIHKHSAIELILHTGKSYFFNYFSQNSRSEVIKLIQKWTNVKVTCHSPQIELEAITAEWKKHSISNFEYLMQVNKYSYRSVHDISQYPVFPWVYINFNSEELNTDEKSFRDFSYPVGAQTEALREDCLRKYNMWKHEDIEPFMYGSHYSSGGIVLHYLMRCEPFRTQAIKLQNGSFDVGDRLFYSMEMSWKSCEAGSSDVKELVPELFYQPWCVCSYDEEEFGKTQSNKSIVHLMYPNWACSYWDFIKKHRKLLESPFVSRELPNWLDLVFGYKQQGKQAMNTYNVFISDTYENKFNENIGKKSRHDQVCTIEQVYHFGQTPACVFNKKPHLKRDEPRNMGIFDNFFYANLNNDLDFCCVKNECKKRGLVHAVLFTTKFLVIVKSDRSHYFIVKYNKKTLEELSCEGNEHTLKQCSKVGLNQKKKELESRGFYTKNLRFLTRNFEIFQNEYLVSGCNTQNSVAIHDLRGQLLNFLSFHTDTVSSIACTAKRLFSASLDSTLVSWRLKDKIEFSVDQHFYGHDSPVISIAVLDSFCIIISADLSERLLIHDFRSGECLKQIKQQISVFDVSEQGFIAAACENKIRFYGLNGEAIYNEDLTDGPIKSIRFNETGDYCLVAQNTSILIMDPTDVRIKKIIYSSHVAGFAIHPLEKYIAVCKNFESKESQLIISRLCSTSQISETQMVIAEMT